MHSQAISAGGSSTAVSGDTSGEGEWTVGGGGGDGLYSSSWMLVSEGDGLPFQKRQCLLTEIGRCTMLTGFVFLRAHVVHIF
jgi:hypothetical protein